MNHNKPSLFGYYILHLVIFGAAVFFLCRPFSTQVAVPSTEVIPETTAAVTVPATEGDSIGEIAAVESSSEIASAESGSSEAVSSDSKNTETAPVKPSSAIPFTSICRINLHIRLSPSLSAKIIGRIPPRASGTILELVDDTWAKVAYQELTGYSAYRYLDFDPSPETAVTAPEEVQKETASTEEAVIVIRSSCYIRSSAGDKNKRNIILTAQGKDVFPHVAAHDQPGWYAIAVEGQSIAYVSTKYAAVQSVAAD